MQCLSFKRSFHRHLLMGMMLVHVPKIYISKRIFTLCLRSSLSNEKTKKTDSEECQAKVFILVFHTVRQRDDCSWQGVLALNCGRSPRPRTFWKRTTLPHKFSWSFPNLLHSFTSKSYFGNYMQRCITHIKENERIHKNWYWETPSKVIFFVFSTRLFCVV